MGAISAQEAEALIAPLNGKPFLVRFSSSSGTFFGLFVTFSIIFNDNFIKGDYSITFKQKGKILHSRVPLSAKYNLHECAFLASRPSLGNRST